MSMTQDANNATFGEAVFYLATEVARLAKDQAAAHPAGQATRWRFDGGLSCRSGEIRVDVIAALYTGDNDDKLAQGTLTILRDPEGTWRVKHPTVRTRHDSLTGYELKKIADLYAWLEARSHALVTEHGVLPPRFGARG